MIILKRGVSVKILNYRLLLIPIDIKQGNAIRTTLFCIPSFPPRYALSCHQTLDLLDH